MLGDQAADATMMFVKHCAKKICKLAIYLSRWRQVFIPACLQRTPSDPTRHHVRLQLVHGLLSFDQKGPCSSFQTLIRPSGYRRFKSTSLNVKELESLALFSRVLSANYADSCTAVEFFIMHVFREGTLPFQRFVNICYLHSNEVEQWKPGAPLRMAVYRPGSCTRAIRVINRFANLESLLDPVKQRRTCALSKAISEPYIPDLEPLRFNHIRPACSDQVLCFDRRMPVAMICRIL